MDFSTSFDDLILFLYSQNSSFFQVTIFPVKKIFISPDSPAAMSGMWPSSDQWDVNKRLLNENLRETTVFLMERVRQLADVFSVHFSWISPSPAQKSGKTARRGIDILDHEATKHERGGRKKEAVSLSSCLCLQLSNRHFFITWKTTPLLG